LIAGFIVCAALGAISGGLVTMLNLPPFIVTLGMLTVVLAAGRLYSEGNSYPVTDDLLGILGQGGYLFGQIKVTHGMTLAVVMFAVTWYALTRTAWGRHVYALGNDPEAARLTGIRVGRTRFSVYLVAGVIYAFAAWQALGRIPNADPNAFQTGNLDSITAVVIGGTSLFGGRGSVMGTVVGALIVAVLRSGLTQAGIDSLYQDVATGVLVIAAVAFDQVVRRRSR
jgi:fructose transport system permease protein